MRRCFPFASMFAAVSAAGFAQVEIPPGFEIVEAVVSDYHIQWPSLNDCGEIAYAQKFSGSWWTAEIMLYDNGRIVRITDNDVLDSGVDLNNSGDMIWQRGITSLNAHQVILYRDGVETLLQDGERILAHASINNLGEAVWSRFRWEMCPLLSDLYLFDGRKTEQIHTSELMLQQTEINDAGWITWMSTDFCVSPWAGTIQLYRDGIVVDLPSFHSQVQGPRINNRGQIVWDAQSDLELWEDDDTRIILDTVDASVPNIGDTGDVYFARSDWDRGTWNAWLYHPEKTGARLYRLSDDQYSVARGSVNGWGEVAWKNTLDNRDAVVFMRRVRTGDSEFDDDVDLRDYAVFNKCMTGPVRTDGLCECRFLDQDYDGDLDLADFARLQNAFDSL
ncbi:MAG: hypothetical protein IT449_08075 [Phycisphaerales bacterium]|nr:hypothetical protein [Phycisphaerales bacterium]